MILYLFLLLFSHVFCSRICEELQKKYKWNSGNIPSVQEGNRIIKKNIKNDCIILLYRIGGTEAGCIMQYLHPESGNKNERMLAASRESGVFPPREDVYDKFINLTIEAIKLSTIFTDMTPLNWPQVRVLGKELTPEAVRVTWYSTVSYWEGDGQPPMDTTHTSWIEALQDKVVLVVSMFHVTGPKQFYRSDSRLPRFKELKWIIPPQAYGFENAAVVPFGWENGKTWVDAFEETKKEIAKAGYFDMALLSCGSFGGPLQSYIYSLNRSSIYLGGSLQALFGIRGNRWEEFLRNWLESHPEDKDWWVKPDRSERPRFCNVVENCPYHLDNE